MSHTLPTETLAVIKQYLNEYASVADDFLAKENIHLETKLEFFKEFYEKDNLKNFTWEDFQNMGSHIRTFKAMPSINANALTKINQPIEKYREAIFYLVYGDDPIELRLNNIKTGNGYSLPYFGKGALSELACYAYPEKYLYISSRGIQAAKFLGINISFPRKSRAGNKLIFYNDAIAPVFNLYREIVGKRTNTSVPLETDLFFEWIYNNYVPDEQIGDSEKEDEETADKGTEVNFWIFAPGSNANKWDEFYENGIMAIDWPYLGNLSDYSSKAELVKKFQDRENDNASHVNDVMTCWSFCNDIKEGDIIISKKGRSKYLGYGIVASAYRYEEDKDEYRNVRNVRWIKRGEWQEDDGSIALKTLTNVTRYKSYVDKLITLLGIEIENGDSTLEGPPADQINNKPFSRGTILAEVFMGQAKIDSILRLLERKKNIILQGPPGVGKTFLAKRLCYLKMNRKDDKYIEMIQFHQSYSYEDFIQGYRPSGSGSFALKNGTFYEFCRKASKDLNNPYFFIIDEINRGNLSKIFGELMMLIEVDKRGPEFSIPLTYFNSASARFYIPSNMHIIGTMNTADRSLALVDFALRRRFAFVPLEPCFNENFKRTLVLQGVQQSFLNRMIEKIDSINTLIREDSNLGNGFLVGHSYFSSLSQNCVEDFQLILDNEIIPLLKEYWFDDEPKVRRIISDLQSW